MKRSIIYEDSYDVRRVVVSDRLYRCLVALFQDFIEIQLSTALGPKWFDKIIDLANKMLNDPNKKGPGRNSLTLKALVEKEDDDRIKKDKTVIDVTIANSIMLNWCYYLVAVPQYHLKKDDAIEIISKNDCSSKDEELRRLDKEALHQRLLALINKDIKVVLECQDKMSGFDKNEKMGKYALLVKNKYIKNNDFYKKVRKLIEDKSALNHMSMANDHLLSATRTIDMLRDLEDFLKFLDIVWDHPAKDDLVARYRDELAVARHLFGTPALNEVTDIINNTISKIQESKLPETKKSVSVPADMLVNLNDFPEGF